MGVDVAAVDRILFSRVGYSFTQRSAFRGTKRQIACSENCWLLTVGSEVTHSIIQLSPGPCVLAGLLYMPHMVRFSLAFWAISWWKGLVFFISPLLGMTGYPWTSY